MRLPTAFLPFIIVFSIVLFISPQGWFVYPAIALSALLLLYGLHVTHFRAGFWRGGMCSRCLGTNSGVATFFVLIGLLSLGVYEVPFETTKTTVAVSLALLSAAFIGLSAFHSFSHYRMRQRHAGFVSFLVGFTSTLFGAVSAFLAFYLILE